MALSAKLHKSGNLRPFDYESHDTCKSCILGKMTKFPFKGKMCLWPLDLIHMDVCGPMSTHVMGGFICFITLTNDFSWYGYLNLMKNKSEAFEKFKQFITKVEKQLRRSIKTLRSDRGGEYLSLEFLDYLVDHAI